MMLTLTSALRLPLASGPLHTSVCLTLTVLPVSFLTKSGMSASCVRTTVTVAPSPCGSTVTSYSVDPWLAHDSVRNAWSVIRA